MIDIFIIPIEGEDEFPRETAVLRVKLDIFKSFSVNNLKAGRYIVIATQWGTSPWGSPQFSLKDEQIVDFDISFNALDERVVKYVKPIRSELDEYLKFLNTLEEEPFCSSLSSEVEISFRFLWIRTFHPLVIVDLKVLRDGEVLAVFKETDGIGEYEIGTLTTNNMVNVKELLLKEGQSEELVPSVIDSILEDLEGVVWENPFRVKDETLGFDGAHWVIEGRKGSDCQIVDRWSPDPDDPIRQAAENIISLSGKRFYYDEVY